MARTSIEKRRAIRKLEAARDDLMAKNKQGKGKLAAVRATLKTVRRSPTV